MGVYTKTGDEGETGLYTGERVKKSSLRVEAYGAIDELDSALALAKTFCRKEDVRKKIFSLQKLLPLLMADLASVGQPAMIQKEHVEGLEKEMDEMEAVLPPLTAFVIPGDTQGGAALDLARTVARRAERCFCRMAEQEEFHDTDRIFLNRLSDYCFLLMRTEEHASP